LDGSWAPWRDYSHPGDHHRVYDYRLDVRRDVREHNDREDVYSYERFD
jgi:hypothetical protein